MYRKIDLAYQDKRYSDGESLCRELISIHPHDAQAKLMHAAIIHALGDRDSAIHVLEDTVALSPTFTEANVKLANLHREAGHSAKAVAVCERFIVVSPNIAAVHNTLGLCRFDQGRLAEAADCFKLAVSLAPNTVRFRQNLAAALERAGLKNESVAVHQRSVASSSNELESLLSTGAMYIVQGKIDKAVIAFQRSAEMFPKSVEAHFELGNALTRSKEPKQAAAAFEKAIALKPGHGEAYLGLGGAYQELGRFSEAIKSFETALSLEPRRAPIYLKIVGSKKIREADRPLVDNIAALLQKDDISFMDRRALHYALAKAYDDLGEYEVALCHLDQATQLTISHPEPGETPWNDALSRAKVEFTIKTFDTAFFERNRKLGSESDLPVLIIGSPRSGTTLLDRILSSHPEIGSAGEQLFWFERVNPALTAISSGSTQAQEIAVDYRRLLRTFGPKKRRVIDKMPMNYGAAGIIHALLPNARFIHCRRHPVDTCLSLYMTAHSMSAVPFGHSRAEIVQGYQDYLRVMEHWRTVLPADRFLEVDYEEIVADREPLVRRIIDFCGLEWNEACLRHEDSTQKVSTPSLWQVRQPIYSTSVERWRQYEPWLGEFRQLLDPINSSQSKQSS
jgi:tetratricopeptide (TPR) repeat protein